MTQAKVARLISATEVAFNKGSDDGVRRGDLATVFRLIQVKDPETGELLGTVRRPKIRFRISEVQPRVSIGETFESVPNPEALSGNVFSPFLSGKLVPEPRLRLRITGDAKSVDVRTTEIQIGDDAEIQSAEVAEA